MPDTEILLRTDGSWIEKTPDVCGGRARIRRTRIPVWLLVEARRIGVTDQEQLDHYGVPITPADVQAAWAYYEQHRHEIEETIRADREA